MSDERADRAVGAAAEGGRRTLELVHGGPEAEAAAAVAPAPLAPKRRARAPAEPRVLRREGRVVTFPDGERVVLAESPRGWRHPGSVSVAGTAAPLASVFEDLGFTVAQADAVRFVAAWFGAPYDAVLATPNGGLVWGFWRFPLEVTARVLSRVESRTPAVWRNRAGLIGLRTEIDDEGAALHLGERVDRTGAAVLRDPLAVAILASLGRRAEVQRMQLQAVLRRQVKPLLDLVGPSLSRRMPASFLAALLVVGRRIGAPAVGQLVPETMVSTDPASCFIELLHRRGRTAEADLARWVFASPELPETS